MTTLTVGKLLSEKREFFEFFPLLDNIGYEKNLTNSLTHRPGLALAGYMERFAHSRIQVLGQTEISFLLSLSDEQLEDRMRQLFSFDIPLFIVTKGMVPPKKFLDHAARTQTPVFQTNLSTTELITRLSIYLDSFFAPQTTIHGSLVDVYGVGLLYTGKSGIGKSECALDLVERGHRLVADDVVKITKKATQVIVGSAVEKLGHHMEVRGIGIIDIEKLFGIRAIRLQKRVEVEVRLEAWDDKKDYDRLGIDEHRTTILGVEIPVVVIPVSPGKNITVISEVISMNHMLKVYGENTAQRFIQRLSEEIARRRTTFTYLEADTE
ncbi:MAG: HPr(Ser) kinase/phosphatase [candidate division Zixibacteria bacterium RBG_16_53_22]|nr:MAG: HPr(Ser) kinase/phosphatase [candidate division Zixibacteria bacterium RBG_16_53_22]